MKLNPTIFLRWIVPSEVIAAYKAGAFAVKNVENPKVQVAVESVTQEIYNGGEEREKFNMTTRDGTRLLVYTTGCKVKNWGDFKQTGFKCGYCGSQRPPGITPTPIILSMEEGLHTEYQPGLGFVNQEVVKINGDNPHCDFNCALSTAMTDLDYPDEVLTNLQSFYRLCYPHGEVLTRALCKRLLDINYGSMTYEEYKAGQSSGFVELIGYIVQSNKRAIVKL